MVNGPGTVILIAWLRIGAQETRVARLDRLPAANGTDDSRHRLGAARRARRRLAGIVDIDAVERRRETVGIALAPHLAIGDDIDAGALLIADRQQRRVILRLFQEFRRDTPEIAEAHARRRDRAQALAIDQPIGLRVAPH